MFRVGIIGGPGPFNFNGFNAMIMQSQQDADRIIEQIEIVDNMGANPNITFIQALDKCGVRESDLTDFDKQRIKRKIEQISKQQPPRGRSY